MNVALKRLTRDARRRGWLLVAYGALLVLAAAEVSLWNKQVSFSTLVQAMETGLFSLLVIQVAALLVFGFATRAWSHTGPGAHHAPRSMEWALLLGITLLGLVLRVGALQEIPVGLWFDTAENGNQALRILRDPAYRPVFVAEFTQLPALPLYLDAAAINLFGAEAFAVRLPAALFGAATIPLLWWLGRGLGGPALGLAAAFALATSRWHIDFSRLAIASIITPFALALTLAAGLAALRATRWWRWVALSVVAGLAVSLALWSYPAGALMAPSLVAGVAWWVARSGRAGVRARAWHGLRVVLVAGVACVISLAPLIDTFLNNPDMVLQRSQAVAITGPNAAQEIRESAVKHLLMFTVVGDQNGRHNTPGRPEVGWFAPFFLAGLGAAVWRWRRGVALAVPATLLYISGGILTVSFEAPQSHRSILALVPVSLLIALPIALFWSRHRPLAVLLSVLLVVAGGAESADYFRAQVYDGPVYAENSILETYAGRWLKQQPPDVPVLAQEAFRDHPVVRFLSGEHPSIAQRGSAVAEYLPLDAVQPVAILARREERALFDRARSLYTQAPVSTYSAPLERGEPLLYAMFVPQRLQEQTRGLLAEDPNGTTTTVPSIEGSNAQAWSATLRVRRSADYRVDAAGVSLAVDGERVLSPGEAPVTLFLAGGAHALRVTRDAAGTAPRLSFAALTPPAPGQAPPTDLPDVSYFALPAPGGLLFTWQIQGQPGSQALVDSAPHRGFEGTFNLGRPWTAQWRGRIRAPSDGTYGFHLEAISSGSLQLDDRPVLPPSGLTRGGETSVQLSAGWHIIRIDYADTEPYARLLVRWRPPGETEFVQIPDDLLQPALRLP